MPDPLETCLLCVLSPGGNPEGAGFLVAADLAVTCAHVVQLAGGQPGAHISLLHPNSGQALRAEVLPDTWRDPSVGDVAFLRLRDPLPPGAQPAQLGSSSGTAGHPIRTFGFPNVRGAAKIAGSGEILATASLAGQTVLQARSPEITPGFSGAPVYATLARRVVGMVASIAAPDRHGRLAETAFIIPSETLRQICPQLQLSDVCPYLGLEVFDEARAEFFFGRQRVVTRLLDSLRREPGFLALLGPSGSGKSSVARVGLLPALRQGKLPGSQDWGALTLRPAGDPYQGLNAAGLKCSPGNLTPAVQSWLEQHPDCTRLLLFIDQFEELFTYTPQATAQGFIAELAGLLASHPNFTLLFTLRDDFYSLLSAQAPALLPWLERGLVNIPRDLEPGELSEIITRPAQAVGLAFEPGLAEAISADVLAASPERRSAAVTILPLLEFALTQLWERRQDGLLLHQAYHDLGGVSGSLAQWADRAYRLLPADQSALARRLLTDLVHLGDETQGRPDARRRLPLADLAAQETDLPAVRQVVAELASARLLVTGRDERSGQETVEIVHDALIHEWALLQSWLGEDRRFLAWRQALDERAQDWLASQKDEGSLLRGGELAQAEEWLQSQPTRLDPDERAYIEASTALRQREAAEREAARQRELADQRKIAATQRQRAIVLAGGMVVALILSLVAFSFYTRSNRSLADAQAANTQAAENLSAANAAEATAVVERDLAAAAQAEAELQTNLARAGEMAAFSLSQLNQDLDLAFLLSIEAYNITDTLETRQSLFESWNNNPALTGFLQGHSDWVLSVAWSPDGRLASGSYDGSVIVWDLEAGQPAQTLNGHSHGVSSLAWSPDGRLASASCAEFYENAICTKGEIIVWALESGGPAQTLQGHSGMIWSVAWSPDGRLASASDDGTVIVWDLERGQPAQSLQGHSDWINSLAWSPDGLLASASDDGTVIVWNLESGRPARTLQGDSDWVLSVAWSPDGRLASGSFDGAVIVWDLESGQPAHTLQGHLNSVRSVAWSPDGRLASGSDDRNIIVWDLESSRPAYTLNGQSDAVLSVAWSPDGRLASGAKDCTVIIWDFKNDQPAKTLHGHSGVVNSVAWSPDGRLASGANDNKIIVWDLKSESGQKAYILQGDWYDVISVAWSLDGRLAFGTCAKLDENGACLEGKIVVWDLEKGRPAQTLQGHSNWVYSVAWSPDGRLVSGSSDGSVIVWDMESGQPTQALQGHSDRVYSVAWSPDGRLAFGSSNDTVIVWDPESGQLTQTQQGESGSVTSVAWSPDGRLASGSFDGSVIVWDLESGRPAQILMGHSDWVWSLAWTSDMRLASGAEDGAVIVWNLESGLPAYTLRGQSGSTQSVAWSPDGHLASGYWDGTVDVWDMKLATWVEQICQRAGRNLTRTEWERFIPWKPFDPEYRTCPQWPAGE